MIRDIYGHIRRLWMTEFSVWQQSGWIFVCVAVRVCLSVGVGYWINENSIKWRDCSVMWSQTEEICWGVITRLLLEGKGCWFSLMPHRSASVRSEWAYSLYSKSIREWSDMLLSWTSGQKFAFERRVDVQYLKCSFCSPSMCVTHTR